jgi:NAD(P)-dependent dehydrogenase (short-subunit alcohol dehydrogenase family)
VPRAELGYVCNPTSFTAGHLYLQNIKRKTNGLKYQFIQTLAAEGNIVIATARNVADLEGKVKADNVPNTQVIQADLTSADSLKAAAKATSSLVNGQIDHLLINGAYLSHTGGMNPTDFADKPELFLEELKKSDEANIAGPLFAINAFLPLLRAGKEKRVTYISSGAADLSETIEARIANSVPYSVSKAGGNLIITKFAAELRDEGFTFLSIAPGAVATETLMDMSKCKLFCFFIIFCRAVTVSSGGNILDSFLQQTSQLY